MAVDERYVRYFESLGNEDVPLVGGKNASLGEMVNTFKQKGIQVPDGFATTADAYKLFLEENDLGERISARLEDFASGRSPLAEVGHDVRRLVRSGTFPEVVAGSIREAYRELSRRYSREDVDVACRSSATAEDLPEASFAGQQESFLNVTGELAVLEACRSCYASLFTDRAIVYRQEKGFEHMKVYLSVGVQKMVRSDLAGSGVMFTIDTETGFPKVVVINATWGLGENVVLGVVTPDEYTVYKPLLGPGGFKPIVGKVLGEKEKKLIYATGTTRTTKNIDTPRKERRSFVLTDEEILTLAGWAVELEDHYGRPLDTEWAKDGETGDIFMIQARPETVQSRKAARAIEAYTLKGQGKRLLHGLAIGGGVAAGKVCLIRSVQDIGRFEEGAVLVTEMTDPDWVPIMKKAAGIITDHGGRTCHAAIVSRELGIPAIVGTAHGTEVLKPDQEITLSCAEGDTGWVYEGILPFEREEISLEDLPETRTRIMVNIASPPAAFQWWKLPVRGIGLARMEFIINNTIQVHPMALLKFSQLKDPEARRRIEELTAAYPDKAEYFVENLALGVGKIAASQHPEPVIVRMSDFKTNEYANLVGGREFEPHEENPMIGFRGASRYYNPRYREGFGLECQAIKRAREVMGFRNIVVMIPFCRTLEEADRVLAVMAEEGLRRGENGLEVYVMAEIPANVILADGFAERFDGFSIGSNDLTQLVLGVDRDSGDLASIFDERNEAVKRFVAELIKRAHGAGRKVGICGQAPSDYPEFAEFLVRESIDSISLNPDSVLEVIRRVAAAERG